MAVEIVEYGDFECPYCRNAYPELRELRRRMGDRIEFVFRHLPIEDKHPHALMAAQAAEAARAQGRFTEMHDMLFEHQGHLEREALIGYAGDLGLDVGRFTSELDNGTYAERIRAEAEAAKAAGIMATPSIYIDGDAYLGFYDAEALSDEVLAREPR